MIQYMFTSVTFRGKYNVCTPESQTNSSVRPDYEDNGMCVNKFCNVQTRRQSCDWPIIEFKARLKLFNVSLTRVVNDS